MSEWEEVLQECNRIKKHNKQSIRLATIEIEGHKLLYWFTDEKSLINSLESPFFTEQVCNLLTLIKLEKENKL